MAYYNTTLTPSSVGNRTVSPGFLPTGYRITVTGKSAASSVLQQSIGMCDNTGYTTVHNTFADTSGSQSGHVSGTGKVVSMLDRISGSITEVTAASHVSFNTTTPGVTFNVTTANTAYQYNVELWS